MITQFITELDQLLFSSFIKCAVDKDYKCLLLDGHATAIELFLAWQALLSKFHEETGNKTALAYIQRAAKMEAINTKITHVTAICEAIQLMHDTGSAHLIGKLAAQLREWGYNRRFTADSIAGDMIYMRNSIDNERVKLKVLKAEHDAPDKDKTDETPGKKYWFKILHAIESYKKMTFDRNKLNMYDFALYINELEEYSKSITIKNLKNGRK